MTDHGALRWPHGAQIAVWITPHLQFARPWGPDAGEYGHRAGFWRMLEVLDRHGIRASVSVDTQAANTRRDILDACVARDWELYACSGQATDGVQDLQDEQIRLACDMLQALSGKPLAGWLAGDAALSDASLERLAGAGLSYLANLRSHDEPLPLGLPTDSLVELPYCEEASDLRCLVQRGMGSRRYAQLLVDQFDQLHAEGARRATVFGLPLHPGLIGMPRNLAAFGAAMAEMAGRDKVWFATGREIADWVVRARFASPAHSQHDGQSP